MKQPALKLIVLVPLLLAGCAGETSIGAVCAPGQVTGADGVCGLPCTTGSGCESACSECRGGVCVPTPGCVEPSLSCDGGFTLADGVCREQCASDANCAGCQVCRSGLCQALEGCGDVLLLGASFDAQPRALPTGDAVVRGGFSSATDPGAPLRVIQAR